MSELEKVQSEYIEFLSKALSNVEAFLSIHHHEWSDEDMKKGKDFRKKIKQLLKN